MIPSPENWSSVPSNWLTSGHRASAEYRDVDLPPPDTKRWVTRRKAVIVSVEEFLAWQCATDTHGVPGLRVTRLQIYRDNPPSRVAKHRSKAGKSVHP